MGIVEERKIWLRSQLYALECSDDSLFSGGGNYEIYKAYQSELKELDSRCEDTAEMFAGDVYGE